MATKEFDALMTDRFIKLTVGCPLILSSVITFLLLMSPRKAAYHHGFVKQNDLYKGPTKNDVLMQIPLART